MCAKDFKLLGGIELCKSKVLAFIITIVLIYVRHFALQKPGVL